MTNTKPLNIGFDTEGTGLLLFHGDLPFMCCFSANQQVFWGKSQVCWEWPVNPMTRTPIYDMNDLYEIVGWFYKQIVDMDGKSVVPIQWYLHNAKYDVRAIVKAIEACLNQIHQGSLPLTQIEEDQVRLLLQFKSQVYEYLDRCQDTLPMSHAINNLGSHGLKDQGIKFLNIPEDDKEILQGQVEACLVLARLLGWKVASAANCPLVDKPKDGWWIMDMWVPAAIRLWAKTNLSHLLLDTIPQEVNPYLTSDEEWDTIFNYCKKYCLTDCDRTRLLGEFFEVQLRKDGVYDAYLLNQRQLAVSYRMEEHGLPFLREEAKLEQQRLVSIARQSEGKARLISGRSNLNLNAPEQVAMVLASRFGIDIERTTKKGSLTVDKDELEELYIDLDQRITMNGETHLREVQEFVLYAMATKKCLKAANTDIAGYIEKCLPENSYYVLHPNFNTTGTDTPRYSSSDPNGQNIQKGKGVLVEAIKRIGFNLRKLFGPPPGRKWYAIDGKQLQVVIAAYTSGVPLLRRAVERGDDLHEFTQRKLAEILRQEYNPDDEAQRGLAKNCNFGYLFGAGEGKTDETAHFPGLYPRLVELFPEARDRIKSDIKFVKEFGFIWAGCYRLYVPSEKPYSATVYKVQGLEAVIIKEAMRVIHEGTVHSDVCLFMTIHDEIIIDVPADDPPELLPWFVSCVEWAGMKYGIPVKADVKVITTNWMEGHSYIKPDHVNSI